MARSFHRKDRMSAMTEINVTPLIDLAFALLIIFMITTPLLEDTITLQLPVQGASEEPQKKEERFQNISINKRGELFWGKEKVTQNRLLNLLRSLSQQKDPPVIHIRASAQIPYQKVVTVLDMAKKENLTKISLDTQTQ